MFKKVVMALAALGVAAGTYLLFIRSRQLQWGATDEEVTRKSLPGMKQRSEREAATASRTVPVPYAQSDGLAIYRFGKGEPILFLPYPHAASVVGDLIPTVLIEGLEQADRQVITFDPPSAGRSTRRARLDLAKMLDAAEEALEHCGVNGPVDVVGHSQGAFAALAFALAVEYEGWPHKKLQRLASVFCRTTGS